MGCAVLGVGLGWQQSAWGRRGGGLLVAARSAAGALSRGWLPRAPPPQAIDLIDEAGSRVRLRHIQLPEEARELDKELKQVTKDKDAAVRGQDFEKAGNLRDREMELKAKISAIVAGARRGGALVWGRGCIVRPRAADCALASFAFAGVRAQPLLPLSSPPPPPQAPRRRARRRRSRLRAAAPR
jgi:ATP-dependent Clp protease ATP-binding subunit ClpA